MNTSSSLLHSLGPATFALVMTGIMFLTPVSAAGDSIIDSFDAAELQPVGLPRMVITDAETGGKSTAATEFADGVMQVTGDLVPGRGTPAFVSIPLILAADGSETNLSNYTGVRLRVKLNRGSLTLQVSTSAVTNFDYHTSAPVTRKPDTWQEVEIPFDSMKQVWSTPTPLDLTKVTSINLVSAGMMPDAFAYEIDEIGLY